MDETMEDAHGEEESPQSTSEEEEDIMAQMATPPEIPMPDDDDDEEDENQGPDFDNDRAVNEDEPEDIEQAEQEEDQEQHGSVPPSSSYLLSRSIPQPKWTINELRGATMQIAYMRQRLFDLKEPVELKSDEFDYYFPFIDNVWVRQHKSRPLPGSTKGTVRTDYYACRLQRPTYQPRKSGSGDAEQKRMRKKKTREGGTCKVRLRAVHYEGGVHAVTLSRVGEHEHSHFLEDMDKMKRNSVVMDIARSEVMKGYSPATVYNVLNNDPAKLAILGGKYLTRSDVRNSSQAWRASYKADLKPHPGYSANDPLGPTLAPKNTPSYPVAPTLPQSMTVAANLPPNTLTFSPALQPFLEPYLPRSDLNVPPGQLPHITLTYATSLDSFLALAPGVQTHLSGPTSKAMTHYLRSRHDAIMVGVGTAAVDNPSLNCRIAGAGGYGGLGWAMHPRPIILDPLARWQLDPKSTNVLRAAQEGRGRAPWIIVAPGFHLDPQRSEMLKYFGGRYLGLADVDPRYPMRPRLKWEAVFRALASEGIRSIMVEGGGSVINDLLSAENRHLVSSLVLTIAPTYMGMGGVVVCPNRAFDNDGKPKPVARFKDVRWCPMGEDVVMTGRFAPETLQPAQSEHQVPPAGSSGDQGEHGGTGEQGRNVIVGVGVGVGGGSGGTSGGQHQPGQNGAPGVSGESVMVQQFGQNAEVVASTFTGRA